MGFKKYLTGELNLDVSPEITKPEDYTLGRNFVKGRSVTGEAGFIEPVRGSTSKDISSSTDTGDICIGMCASRDQSKMYLFMYNSTAANNKIIQYTISGGTSTVIIEGAILNFSQSAMILNAKEINGYLYFVDGVNEARCVSTTKWVSGTPTEEDISIGKRPMAHAPLWQKFEDAAVNGENLPNLLSGYDFQFASQYVYDDNKRSVVSSISTLAASNLPDDNFKRIRVYLDIDSTDVATTTTDGTTGYVTAGYDSLSSALPERESVPQTVEKVNILVRIGNFGSWNIVDTIERVASGGDAGKWERNWYDFKNNTNGIAVEDRYNISYDLIPRKPSTQELAKNKMFYGNFYEGYDSPSTILTAGYSETEFIAGGYVNVNIQLREQNRWFFYQASDTSCGAAGYGTDWNQIGEDFRFVVWDSASATYKYIDDTSYQTSLGTSINATFQYTSGQYRVYLSGATALASVSAGDYIAIPNVSGNRSESTGCNAGTFTYMCKVSSVNSSRGYVVVDSLGQTYYQGGSTLTIKSGATGCYFITPQDVLDAALRYTHADTYEALTTGNCFNCENTGTKFVMGYVANSTYSRATSQSLGSYTVQLLADKTDYDGLKSFSSNSSYRLGIVYKDAFMRSCGVVTNPAAIVDIIGDDYIFNAKIQWNIDTSEDSKVPSWAKYYSIVRTKNLQKSYFLEYHTGDIYYQPVNTDGSFGTATYTYDPDNGRAVVDIKNLLSTGKGYSFNQGDRIILFNILYDETGTPTESGVTKDIPIQSLEDGTKIILSNQDLLKGNATAEDGGKPLDQYQAIRFEIYNPTESSLDSIFYEVGQTYNIVGGNHSVYAGELDGDTINVLRNKYIKNASGNIVVDPATNASPDLYRAISAQDDNANAQWNTNIGHPYIVDDIGEVYKEQYFRWSNQFIQDTKINGVNEFEPLNEKAIPVENGPIQALRLTNKVQGEGTVMLSINRFNPSSIYLDEQQWTDNVGNETAAVSVDDVGTVRSQQNLHGCVNPESVFAHKGQVYWFDADKGEYVRYTKSGTAPISEQKTATHFSKITSGSKVITFYDPFYKMVFASAYSHSDGSGSRTIGFDKYFDQWRAYYDIRPSFGLEVGDTMYTMVNNSLYSHDSSTYNSWYGTAYNLEVEMSFNEDSQTPKDWKACQIQVSPELVDFTTPDPVINVTLDADFTVEFINSHGQETDLIKSDFDIDNFIAYSDILYDTNSTGGLMEGDEMSSNSIRMKVSVNKTSYFNLKFFEIGFLPSLGHQI